MKVAAGFDSGSGMIEQLERATGRGRALQTFFCATANCSEEYEIETKKAISEFTHYGSPKVLERPALAYPKRRRDRLKLLCETEADVFSILTSHVVQSVLKYNNQQSYEDLEGPHQR